MKNRDSILISSLTKSEAITNNATGNLWTSFDDYYNTTIRLFCSVVQLTILCNPLCTLSKQGYRHVFVACSMHFCT